MTAMSAHATRPSRVDSDGKQHVFRTDVFHTFPASNYCPSESTPLRFFQEQGQRVSYFLNSDTLSICSTTAANCIHRGI
ncbi:uncharacterized protein LACBIDRAFT_310877 [Laccaria bicolor S238N-H82]|uniref:Predicted protein n=1 Tax=Laccaria bicolor (strain S238N-H82 / ATCC MYA-4686) TaxID=486041 RepID=B0DVA9_LACBS|nr:uncharacterized protein LACBIDRAFT_310877 [Laccaria bicolor S238N-H82]EDR01545.1 predicted protein [Laccaria bicolor S238N-H82]|eukprot:XP_001887897.1 predicted protein [Laccaria bicolor S238N-H82]